MGNSPTGGEPGAVEPHRGIRTFLIADVRGYTLFTQTRGDEAAAKLAARFAGIAREGVEEHGGSVIELRGDEALAAFDSARQAILAAVRCQDRFLEETLADASLSLPVGIGLDAGEAVPLESGFRGGALNLAARLCGRAGPGEILASEGVAHLAGKVEGVRYVDRGDLHLKGLADPVRVVRVVSEDGDPAEGFLRLAPERPARGPAPIRLARRHPIGAVLVVLALIAALAVPATFALRGGGSSKLITTDAVGIIDLESGELKGSVSLPSRPGAIAVGEGSVWVALPDRGAVIQIDAKTMSIRDSVSVGANPVGIAVGTDAIWVANGGNSTVSRISSATNEVGTIEVPGAPAAIAVNDEGVWVADSIGDAISPIDPVTGDVLDSIPVGDQPVDLAENGEELWVANAASGSVSRVNLIRNEVQPVDVGEGPQAVAVGAESDLGGELHRGNRFSYRSGLHQYRHDPRRRCAHRSGLRRWLRVGLRRIGGVSEEDRSPVWLGHHDLAGLLRRQCRSGRWILVGERERHRVSSSRWNADGRRIACLSQLDRSCSGLLASCLEHLVAHLRWTRWVQTHRGYRRQHVGSELGAVHPRASRRRDDVYVPTSPGGHVLIWRTCPT